MTRPGLVFSHQAEVDRKGSMDNLNSPICIFVHSFSGGGAERVAVLLANAMVDHGWNVEVVVQKSDGPWKEALNPRTELIVLGGRFRWLTFKMARYLRLRRPEAVIAFLPWINMVAIVATALSGWRGRLIVSERSSLEGMVVKKEPKVWWILKRLLYRRADCIVSVSQKLARDLSMRLRLPSKKVVAIPNPVPVEEIRKGALAPVSHRFFTERAKVVMAVGRLHFVKDFPTLIRAIADLRSRRDVRLIVLGEGPFRSELESLVVSLGLAEVVDLPGFISPPWPWMARADVLALSSRAEGWPNVLAEAMALGVPVVATDCPTGPREVLDGGRFGMLVPVGDFIALSAALEHTLDNPPDRAALRQRAEEWSPGRILDAYLSCIKAHGAA